MRTFRCRSGLVAIVALAPLWLAASVFADHVSVSPQPGFNAAEAARLVHTDSDKNDVMAAQLRLGSEYVRLGMRRLAAGDLQDGATGWWEPTFLGYKLVSKAHQGVEAQMSKSKVKDPLLSMEWKKLSDSRALMRNALESVNHIKAGEAEAIAAGVRSLNDSLVLVQQAKALLL
jgi:hypothetical protein